MATIMDLKRSVNDVIRLSFPNMKIYSYEAIEGMVEPCFITKIVPLTSDNDTVNYTSNQVMVVINYFSEEETEIDNLSKDKDLRVAFGMSLKVNQRSFLIKNIRSEIIDEVSHLKNGVLQFRFNLDFLVSSDRKKNLEDGTDYDLMQEINLDLKRRD